MGLFLFCLYLLIKSFIWGLRENYLRELESLGFTLKTIEQAEIDRKKNKMGRGCLIGKINNHEIVISFHSDSTDMADIAQVYVDDMPVVDQDRRKLLYKALHYLYGLRYFVTKNDIQNTNSELQVSAVDKALEDIFR